MEVTFGIAFFHARGKAKNVRTTETSKFDVYYRCLSVAFASIRRCYPQAPLFLFSDKALPEPFASTLNAMEVVTEIVIGNFVERTDLWSVFPGCLYTLDIIKILDTRHGDLLFLLDPDVLMRRPIADLTGRLSGGQIAALPIGYGLSHLVQEQSRASLSMLAARCGCDPSRLPITYYGGEFYGLPTSRAPELGRLIDHVLANASILPTEANRLKITEEHILSVVFALIPDVVPATDTIKRIWTAPSFSNWEAKDANLPLWHLPAEKNRLFHSLHTHVGTIPRMATAAFDALIASTFRHTPTALIRSLASTKKRLTAVLRALTRPA